MPVSNPKALLFDMDGLLVDSEPLWFDVEREFVRARGGEFSAALAATCVGRGLANTLAVMERECGIAIDPARDTDILVESFIARARELRLKPGARALLDAARSRVRVGLASSSPKRLVHAVLDELGIASEFDVIVSGECVAHVKPAPDIFLHAAAALGMHPADCVVLEDSAAGVTAGRAAGMIVIAVPEGDGCGRGFEQMADAVVSDLFEARRCLALGRP